ncbi:MAG: hypothetical protein KAI66_22330, partial [Lentisphaeria bacterium]|nr:hypothetical protein [Lentisphaeria bacterium]
MHRQYFPLPVCLLACLLTGSAWAIEIVIDEFTSPELPNWGMNARVWRDGKGQPIEEKPFSLTHTSEPNILAGARGGLRVEFASAKAKKTPNCYGLLRRVKVPHPAPETDCLVLDLIVEAGGGQIRSVDLFNASNWKKFTGGEIPLDFEGFRQVVLKRDDMTTPKNQMKWEEVNYIQLVVFGDVIFTISSMRWADSRTLLHRPDDPQRVTRAKLPVQDVTPGATALTAEAGDVVLFARNPLERCSYKTAPRDGEMLKQLAIFATPGEYEPATFSVHTKNSVPDVTVTLAGDLEKKGGQASIPSTALEVRVITPMSLWLDTRHMRQVEYLLTKQDTIDLEPGRTTRFWVTLHIPAAASPGTYHGMLLLRSAGREIAKLPYQVEVLPIQLAALDDITYFMYFRSSKLPAWGQTKEYFTKCLIDMREHGINSISAYVYPDGSPPMETARPGTL